ncbi:hypothetical protein [Azohydromonas lata]|uniref:hypothetical protein n=1 Tax=Azohydromonas lata TaxID=45677 RepID=UPI0012F4FF8A|nr:hypothetical protein [Azohydromonas lata]
MNRDKFGQTLSKYKLGIVLHTEDIIINPWFRLLEVDATQMCRGMDSAPIDFCFSDSNSIQAYAIYEERMVVVTKGMFSMISKLAMIMVSKKMFPALGSVGDPEWSPKLERTTIPLRQLLNSEEFDWVNRRPEWIASKERQGLFFYLLLSLFRFVVLHEIGHIVNKHGDKHRTASAFEVDQVGGSTLSREQAVSSQAKESVADHFAFHRFLNLLHRELKLKGEDELLLMLKPHLFSDVTGEIGYSLMVSYLFFSIMDRGDWWAGDPYTFSHPPAPFRVRTLLAGVQEFGAIGLNADECGLAVAKAALGAEAIVATSFGRFPDMYWLDSVSGESYKNIYQEIFEELPKWQWNG